MNQWMPVENWKPWMSMVKKCQKSRYCSPQLHFGQIRNMHWRHCCTAFKMCPASLKGLENVEGKGTAKIIDQAYWNLLCKMKKYAPRSPRTWSFENIHVVSGLFLTICVAMCDLYLDLSFVPLISVSRQWSLWYPVRPEKSGWSNARQFFYGRNTGDTRRFLLPAGRTGKRNMPLVMSKRLVANWRPSRPEKLEITGTRKCWLLWLRAS